MIRARVWFRRGGGQTVRCWVPAGDMHDIRLTGPCRVVLPDGSDLVLGPNDGCAAGPFLGPFSYTVRYGR
jgi:hypothetical protein